MKQLISFSLAVKIVKVILSLVVAFHLMVMLGFVPAHIVWGGRMKTTSQLLVFESVSIIVNLILLAIVFLKNRSVNNGTKSAPLSWALALCSCLFALNTVGNLMAKSSAETLIFTPITLVLSVLFARIALS